MEQMQKIKSVASCAAGALPTDTAPLICRQDTGSTFDRLARPYRWLEYAMFGRGLLRCRFDLLPWLADARRVLTVGEGDGRFVAELARQFPEIKVDCVEASGEMIACARERLPANTKVRFHQADALEWDFSKGKYDAVVTCFFLDCFSSETLAVLMPRLAASVRPEGQWLVTEFHQPSRGMWRCHAKAWLAAMYFFFRHATRLEARRLPDWEGGMARLGLRCCGRLSRRWNLIAASRWSCAGINSQNCG